MTVLPSLFARPNPNGRIKPGTPPLTRPTREEVAMFPTQAQALLDETWAAQKTILSQGGVDVDWVQGRHFLLVGATGPGLGGAIATALLHLLSGGGSLTVVARDLSRSVGYEMGKLMTEAAQNAGWADRFRWLNSGIAVEGKAFGELVAALQTMGAERIVYLNGVAAASSGMLPGMPQVYVTDVDDEGMFQWELPYLNEKAIQATKLFMGEMAVALPEALSEAGIEVDLSVFADWRGSLDRISRDPSRPEYGRQGAYSTSLYLPKEIIHDAVSAAYGQGPKMIDICYPIMRTRALPLIPGGTTMAQLYDNLMRREGIRRVEVPELGLQSLEVMGRVLTEGYDNPYPRLDNHEIAVDEWFYEVVQRLNNDENSPFFYRHWLTADDAL